MIQNNIIKIRREPQLNDEAIRRKTFKSYCSQRLLVYFVKPVYIACKLKLLFNPKD